MSHIISGEDGELSSCNECNKIVPDGRLLYIMHGDLICELCEPSITDEIAEEAEAYANCNCKINKKIHEFNSACESHGGRYNSYTRNAVACGNRHSCTNYDSLIVGLDRYDHIDQIYYDAIRTRTNELIEEDDDYLEGIA